MHTTNSRPMDTEGVPRTAVAGVITSLDINQLVHSEDLMHHIIPNTTIHPEEEHDSIL